MQKIVRIRKADFFKKVRKSQSFVKSENLFRCPEKLLRLNSTSIETVFSVVWFTFVLREKCPNTEFFLVRSISPYSAECGKIRTRKNSAFGHFSRSVCVI